MIINYNYTILISSNGTMQQTVKLFYCYYYMSEVRCSSGNKIMTNFNWQSSPYVWETGEQTRYGTYVSVWGN
jgi:hypothetical protein